MIARVARVKHYQLIRWKSGFLLMKNAMKMKTLDEVFADDLQDADFVREYLQIALEENGPEGLAIAMRRVLSARSSNTPTDAESREVSGESLAGFQKFYRQLTALGMDIRIVAYDSPV